MKQGHSEINGLYSVTDDQRVPSIALQVMINNKNIMFEVDSGSAYTIMSEEEAGRLWPDGLPQMEKTDLCLKTWTCNRVQLLGRIQVQVEYKKFNGNLYLLIAKGGGQSLLGRAWFSPLGISIESVHSVQEVDMAIEFQGYWNQY